METVLIEFVEVWGHPTKNEIYGPPERYWVSEWAANNLVTSGVAKVVTPKKPKDQPVNHSVPQDILSKQLQKIPPSA